MESSGEFNSGIPIAEKPIILDKLAHDAYPANVYGRDTQESIHNSERPRKRIEWAQIETARDQFFLNMDAYYDQLSEEIRPPDHHREMIKIAALGPLALPQDMFRDKKDGERFPTEYKEKSARAQALIAHTIFATSFESVSSDECANIYDMVAIIDNIANSDIGEAQGFRQWWSGTKSLLAVVRALHEQQYTVLLPDYAQNPVETSKSNNQMLQFDVYNAVDLLARDQEGNVFLVDCKGEGKIKNTSIRRAESSVVTNPLHNREFKRFPPVLSHAIRYLQPQSIHRARITVPSSLDMLPRLRVTDGFENGRMELAAFAKLPHEQSLKIANGLIAATKKK